MFKLKASYDYFRLISYKLNITEMFLFNVRVHNLA